jgi:hypothetical protein
VYSICFVYKTKINTTSNVCRFLSSKTYTD